MFSLFTFFSRPRPSLPPQPDYFIMIQFFATMAVLLELISFILLAYYYLAPSQSKAAKAKSMLALNRARSTATLGGAGINGHPGSTSGPASTSGRGFSKSVASLATTTGGASGVTSSLRPHRGGAGAVPTRLPRHQLPEVGDRLERAFPAQLRQQPRRHA